MSLGLQSLKVHVEGV